MGLTAGTKLGPYEIVGALGAGGMGEVYKARDTRLDRLVAIKILPDTLAADPRFRDRFDREGKAIAALSHPHICTLHDVGQQDGTAFLVMELLEGETLGERLEKGPLPLDQAIRYAIQIADALDKAHSVGIIHRDLKPANVMLTKGIAKLLDFGLAKARTPVASGGLSALPTAPQGLTAQGTILGTFQYMAPEQLGGIEADQRTDIFAFGVVVYEMLTGRKAFEGTNQASLIGAILHLDPPAPTALQPLVPLSLDRVVRKCLRKDPDERWQTTRDLLDELRWAVEDGTASAPVAARERWREQSGWIAAAAVFLWALSYVGFTPERTAPSGAKVVLSVNPPENTTFSGVMNVTTSVPLLALSPDGRSLAFAAAASGVRPSLWIRSLDEGTARLLPGTENAEYPFWSPDGEWVAFFADGNLKRIARSGGPAQVVLDGVSDPRGGSWSLDGTILIGSGSSAILRTAAVGGSAPATKLDASREEASHRWPVWLPDGRHFLFVARAASSENSGVFVGSLDGAPRRLPIRTDGSLGYAPPGYVLFLEGKTLVARSFDLDRHELGDETLILAQGVGNSSSGLGAFSVSASGMLAYAGSLSKINRLTWFDRKGKQVGSIDPDAEYLDLRLSSDDIRLAVSRVNPDTGVPDIWMHDLARGDWSQFTFGPRLNAGPIWSPDGKTILFRTTRRGGTAEFYQKSSGGGGSETPVLAQISASASTGSVSDWSPDGKELLYSAGTQFSTDLWLVPLADVSKPTKLLGSASDNMHGAFSPNGRLLAYSSNESGGRFDVYVQTLPLSDLKRVVSTSGGYEPRWRADGREVYYLSPDGRMMAVSVGSGPSFGVPEPLFQVRILEDQVSPFRTHYVPNRDGTRFLVAQSLNSPPPAITLVLNWAARLEK